MLNLTILLIMSNLSKLARFAGNFIQAAYSLKHINFNW